MDGSRFKVAAPMVLFHLLGAIPMATATEPNLAERIADAVRFRTDFGLPADPGFVAETLVSDAYDSATYGVPLSAAEIADLNARAELRNDFVPALTRAIESSGYAGAYIDQARRGQPVILTTNRDALAAALQEVEDASAKVEVRDAQFSVAELEELQRAIEANWKELEDEGIDIVSVGQNTKDNRLEVGVRGLTEEIAKELSRRYGPVAHPHEDRSGILDACSNVSSCWPMKGGLRIRLVANTGKYCTAGFLAEKTDTGALTLLTAGHCLALVNNSGTDYWGHAGSPAAAQNIGWELPSGGEPQYHTWFDNSDADVGLIFLDTDTVAALGPANEFHWFDPTATGLITGVQAPSQQLTGDHVCRMGYGTFLASGSVQGRTCGTIGSRDVSRESCTSTGSVCKTIKHQWEVSFDSVGGDSGGPVTFQLQPPYPQHLAYGTHVHSEDPEVDPAPHYGWYSPIQWGRTAYQNDSGAPYTFNVCFTASC